MKGEYINSKCIHCSNMLTIPYNNLKSFVVFKKNNTSEVFYIIKIERIKPIFSENKTTYEFIYDQIKLTKDIKLKGYVCSICKKKNLFEYNLGILIKILRDNSKPVGTFLAEHIEYDFGYCMSRLGPILLNEEEFILSKYLHKIF